MKLKMYGSVKPVSQAMRRKWNVITLLKTVPQFRRLNAAFEHWRSEFSLMWNFWVIEWNYVRHFLSNIIPLVLLTQLSLPLICDSGPRASNLQKPRFTRTCLTRCLDEFSIQGSNFDFYALKRTQYGTKCLSSLSFLLRKYVTDFDVIHGASEIRQ